LAGDGEPVDRHARARALVEDSQAQDHLYELAWLRAEDVHRFLKT
jgi:hypothetical protein